MNKKGTNGSSFESGLRDQSTGYKCPNCKHLILLKNTDFIKGIAMVSCMDCGKDAFTIK